MELKILCIFIMGFPLIQICNGSLIKAILEQNKNEPKDTIFVKEEYDFIVIGAGSAGCVVAARLSENPDFDVLLIEAGGRETFYADIPAIAPYLRFTSMDWQYYLEKSDQKNFCVDMVDGKCGYGRGKVVGGSSTINYQYYTRGHRDNFDEWSRLGNDGWSYEEILPYFKKIEDFDIGEEVDMKYHGTGGPVYVGYPIIKTRFAEITMEASKQLGFDEVDYNGEQQIGVSRVQANIKNGIRVSASRAYLHPIKDRKNFSLKKLSTVKRILINPLTKNAYGVEFVDSMFTYQIKARNEVILSAGSINSPQILMLSGVGPKEHLEQMNIELIHDLPVAQHSMDHVLPMPLVFVCNQTLGLKLNFSSIIQYLVNGNGILASTVTGETILFANVDDTNDKNAVPNIELAFMSSMMAQHSFLTKSLNIPDSVNNQMYSEIMNNDTISIAVQLLQPKSRGKLLLKDNKYDTPPIIKSNCFDKVEDLKTMVKGLRLAMKIVEQDAFKEINAKIWWKKLKSCEEFEFNSDDYLICYSKHLSTPLLHLVGTCRMGPDSDPLAVVDNRLRVKGIKGLRVVDASIMPHIVAAHTNAAATMIGEKGADLIKDEHS